MTKALVLNGCGIADALVSAKGAIGKQVPLPTFLKRSICEVVDLNLLARKLVSKLASLRERSVSDHRQAKPTR